MALIRCSDCGRDISDAAVACPGCGRPVDRRPQPDAADRTLLARGLLLLFGICGIALFSYYWNGGLTDGSGRLVLPQPIGATAPVVTKAEFDQLREGISYEEAVRIIGAPGDLLSSSDLAGIKTVMYAWHNGNGSNMNAMFQNGKLITKAQLGLP